MNVAQLLHQFLNRIVEMGFEAHTPLTELLFLPLVLLPVPADNTDITRRRRGVSGRERGHT